MMLLGFYDLGVLNWFNPLVENKDLQNQEEIDRAIALGEYIRNGACRLAFQTAFYDNHSYMMRCLTETIALYSLRKYRHLKRMYPDRPVLELTQDQEPQKDKVK